MVRCPFCAAGSQHKIDDTNQKYLDQHCFTPTQYLYRKVALRPNSPSSHATTEYEVLYLILSLILNSSEGNPYMVITTFTTERPACRRLKT